MARLLRLLMALLRGGLALCSLLLVLLGLYVSLGRELTPLVAEYQAEVQREAQAALGLPVRIGRLEGSWRGLGPLLVAHDVQLGSGAASLHLDQLRLQPDLLTSLAERRLEVQLVELEGLQLSVRQQPDGGWTVDGLPHAEGGDPLQQLALLQGIDQLLLLDSQLTLQANGLPSQTLTYVDLSLRNSGRRQRLDGQLTLPDGQPLRFSLRTRLDLQDWRQTPAELYLSLPQSDWARWLPAGLTAGWQVGRLQAGGEFWLSASAGQLQRLVARVHAPELRGGPPGRAEQSLQDLALTAYYDRQADGFDLRLESLALSLGNLRWGPLQLALSQRREGTPVSEHWRLQADRLDLAPLAGLSQTLLPLPEAVLPWLAGLQPTGQLHNLQVDYRPALPLNERVQYAANLSDVGISPYADVPGTRNVSGSLTGNLGGGELRLASQDFVLDLAEIFPQPWHYRQVAAALLWSLDEQAFTLRSPYIRLDGEEGRIAGDMLIRIPQAADGESYMDLRVGLRDGNAAFTGKYLPRPSADFSADLANWLTTAIRAGAIDEGIFQYQGALSSTAPDTASTLGLYFKLHQLALAYQPGWPELREASGEVWVGDSGVQVAVSTGSILDSQVSAVQASVAAVTGKQVSRLKLAADLQSSVGDALQILQQAPLGAEVQRTFAGWSGQGPLSGKLSLDIPLEGRQPPQVVVDFATQNAQLSISDPQLQLSQISGAFRYNTASGLSSPDFRARAFDRAVRGRIVAEGARGRTRTRVEANGQIALNSLLGWLGVERKPLPLSGSLPYWVSLILDGEDSQLRVDSSLQGLAIDLPAPFGKAAGEQRKTQWRMSLGGAERRYWLQYGDLLGLSFAAPPGQLEQGRGELQLGASPAQLPTSKGLRIAGSLAALDMSAWEAFDRRYAISGSTSGSDLLRSASLQIGHFTGFGLDLQQLSVELTRQAAAWQLGLRSSLLEGQVQVPDQRDQPIALNLQRLTLPAAPTSDAEADARPDALAAIDPSSIPPMNVQIAQVLLGSEALGAWSFKLRPANRGVLFSELSLWMKGLHISGNGGWQGSPGATRSWYKGRLQGQNLADVLKAWNYAPTATSERFRLDADINWPGSPSWVSLDRLSGTLDASMRKGSFVEVQGGAQALRVFGLLNFNAIGRRLRLDFSDLFGKGLAYDRVTGVLNGTRGVFNMTEPLTMVGPSGQLKLDGTLDLAAERINAQLHVSIPVSNTLPLAALIAGAPAVAGALFVVDKLFGNTVSNLVQVQYKVQGALNDPQISFDKPY